MEPRDYRLSKFRMGFLREQLRMTMSERGCCTKRLPVPRKLRPDSYADIVMISHKRGFLIYLLSYFFLFALYMQVGSFHAVGHLILEEIPIHDDKNSNTPDVRDVTAVQIELKAVSKVRHEIKMNNPLTE